MSYGTTGGTYNPDWKQEYIQLKGWDNMSDGEKYLTTHACTSSAIGMGMRGLQRKLEEMKRLEVSNHLIF